MSAALFGRRSRGWVDELDGIRDQALAEPNGEVAAAMGGTEPLDEVPGGSPLASLEAPLALAGSSPHAVPPLAAAAPLAGPDLASLPAPPAARWSNPSHQAPPTHTLPPPPKLGPPLGSATPSPEAMASPPTPPPALADLLHAAAAPVVPSPVVPVSPVAPPPPPRFDEPSAWAPPPRLVPPTAPVDEQPADEHPVVPVDEPSAPEVVPATSSPHPIRPHEMWHAAVDPQASADSTEERLELAELVEPEVVTSRFRFARLRPVGTEPEGLTEADVPTAHLAAPPAEAPVAEPSDPDGLGPFDARPGPPAELWSVDHGAAPLIPITATPNGGGLINGPVSRRPVTDGPAGRRGLPMARTNGSVGSPEPSPVEAVEVGPVASVEPTAAPAADASAEASAGDASATVDVPVAEVLEPAEVTEPAEPDPVPGELVAPVEAPAPEVVELVVSEVPEPTPLLVADDGTVELDGSHLRLGDPALVPVRDGDGVSVELASGWCWSRLGDDAPTVQVTLPVGTLAVPAGTQALAVVEADGSSFVVVVDGEATLVHHGGRMRLRRGAMALAPPGGEPQVDVATEDEIGADPLVQRNLGLDASR